MLKKSFLNISNLLTISRILITPVIFGGIVRQEWTFVFILFLIAGLTDVLDGYVARKFGLGTEFGACLDPIADKILLISSFAALSFIDSPSFAVPRWFFFLILVRETIILGGALLLFIRGIRLKVVPSIAGKLTTFFQLSFIWWIFICYFFGWNPARTYSVSIVLLALFSLMSLAQYGARGFSYLKR
jgi:cardiolipin synthase